MDDYSISISLPPPPSLSLSLSLSHKPDNIHSEIRVSNIFFKEISAFNLQRDIKLVKYYSKTYNVTKNLNILFIRESLVRISDFHSLKYLADLKPLNGNV